MIVFDMGLEMPSEAVNALGKDGHLHESGPGVFVVDPVLLNDGLFLFFGDGHAF